MFTQELQKLIPGVKLQACKQFMTEIIFAHDQKYVCGHYFPSDQTPGQNAPLMCQTNAVKERVYCRTCCLDWCCRGFCLIPPA